MWEYQPFSGDKRYDDYLEGIGPDEIFTAAATVRESTEVTLPANSPPQRSIQERDHDESNPLTCTEEPAISFTQVLAAAIEDDFISPPYNPDRRPLLTPPIVSPVNAM